ncbi:asparagine synthase (glutamine-hydrolyzing) [Methylocystis parvus]|uniref:asparagine synthase (glutamine-hydrolyzing) n=1 Tax=Methylocystis parvus TaxID=134 RepID=A0A6B8M9G3_9HYPH|nr:asparagine synthase (glutamine-hydrolyzing) [Methylocystis parvus]QGM99238.1 asparagine synthase (glutamine-hydrolyzing) [Methylocystis parvus]WBK00381.1 asparagine synthase (glutamine-hydrolyzing) [Methylocystis parvus OBBP]
MCGIFGWILPPSSSFGRDALISLTDKMRHRGPDGGGYELVELHGGRFSLGLGHRRLSIIDLSSNGAQPMWSADRRFCVVFNGEIYNYIELRRLLTEMGAQFRSSSDTEALIEAYRAWGADCVERFRGMFAFAIYDAHDQTVFFARDKFGKKPLYFYRKNGRLLFSSEIEPLTLSPGFDRSFDWEALDEYLLDRFVPGEGTFFTSIRKLPPGCTALWRDGELAVRRYFSPPLAQTTAQIYDFQEAARRLRDALDEAVRLRMRSDAPFGAFLSGGVDSSAILALMTRYSSQPIKTFCADFAESGYSEAEEARAIADWHGADHVSLRIAPSDFLSHWDEAIIRRGAPVSEGADIAIMMLAKRASQDVKMALTGEGADEFLCGYPKYLAERHVALYQSLVPASLHDRVVAPLLRRAPVGRRLKVLAKALSLRDPKERVRAWFGDLSEAERRTLLGRPARASDLSDFALSLDASNVRRSLFFDQASWLPGNTLERGDRMTMAGSIEARMPFMDAELAVIAAKIPDRLLMRRGTAKAVLREAMKDVLPEWILRRRKNGFRAPFAEWMRGSHKEALLELLASDQSTMRRLLDRDALDALVTTHLDGRADNSRVIWSLMNLEKFICVYKPDLGAHSP